MDRRTEQFLKETRERELDRFVLDRTRRYSDIVDLGRLGKIPISIGWRYPGVKVYLSDLSYYTAPPTYWGEWREQVVNDAARIPVADNIGRIPMAVVPEMPPGVVRLSPGVIYEGGLRYRLAPETFGFTYTFSMPFDYVRDPIVWREDCPTRRGVERWLLRVQQEKELDTPPDLEWE